MEYFSKYLTEIASSDFRQEVIGILTMGVGLGVSNLQIKPSEREEGNVITAYCFRNTILEDIHANAPETTLDNKVMKELMIESSSKVTAWLKMRDLLMENAESIYFIIVNSYQVMYTQHWNKD
ncbi:hypothetical protein [Bacillus sp. J33]|uniref:hypothetical protein n=1 Tax=Bacillus sp. J33 TaxID=935836 RepID=UPI0004BC8F9F|nr:hypothetical protein [Bacillus sp. J33]